MTPPSDATIRARLAERTAMTLAILLTGSRARRWFGKRGAPVIWRQLQPYLTVRPSLARAVEAVAASPDDGTRHALAMELAELFSEDRALAELARHELEEDRAAQMTRATRARRWTKAASVAAAVVLLTASALALFVLVLQDWIDFTEWNSSVVFAALPLAAVLLGFGYWLYRRQSRFASLVNWLLLLGVTGAMVATLAATDAATWGPYLAVNIGKVFAVVVLAVLPGWLYFQFVALRGRTVWEDYVLSLFRLGIDEPAHLPEPPAGTRAYRMWSERGGDGEKEAGVLYRDKFEATHGKAVLARHWDTAARRRRTDGFGPVVLFSVLVAFGWTAILLPFYGEWTDTPIWAIGHVDIGGSLGAALGFGVAGAYWFNVQSLVRRYFQNDLRPNAYISGAVRIIVVLLIITAVYEVWQMWPSASVGALYAMAFLIGVFPRLGLQLLAKGATRLVAKMQLPELRNPFPLGQLDGLNMWYEARLVEEGIEDMQNLTTADMVEMLLTTRVPVGRLVDWIDQAALYLRVTGPTQRTALRQLGIRTASDLLDAFPSEDDDSSRAAAWEDRARQIGTVLYENNPEPAAAVDLLLSSFKGEANLRHACMWRAWRDSMADAATLESPRVATI